MSVLNELITDLASEFAAKLVVALGKLSLDEIGEFAEISGVPSSRDVGRPVGRPASVGRKATHSVEKTTKTGGKRVRRTAGDIHEIVDSIVAFVRKCEDGATAENIRFTLGLERKDLPRPIAEALASGLLRKVGQKRATTYFAV